MVAQDDSTSQASGSGAGAGALLLTKRQHAVVLLSLALGTLVEWFDFQLYSGLSNQIANQFFPKDNKTVQALFLWMVFAIGFVTRPLGAIFFGHIGDAVGRRLSLMTSITCMAFPTVLIGCLPSYDTIGIAAPILMGILRTVQGFALGGEYGTAVVYAVELAPPGFEGRHSSYIVASCSVGLVLGEVVVLAVVSATTPQQLEVWGWRIPFLSVILTAGLALIMRSNLPEPLELIARARLARAKARAEEKIEGGTATEYGQQEPLPKTAEEVLAKMKYRIPLIPLLKTEWPNLLLFILIVAYASTSTYAITTYLPNHLRDLGVGNATTQLMSLTGLACKLAAVLLTGWAADRLGPRGMHMTAAGVVNSLVGVSLTFGLDAVLSAYKAGESTTALWVFQVLLLGITGNALALLPTIGCNLYTTATRASGYSLSYSLAAGFLGGLSPMAVTAIRAAGTPCAKTYASGLWLLANGGASFIAYIVATFTFPEVTHARAALLLSETPDVDIFQRRRRSEAAAANGNGGDGNVGAVKGKHLVAAK